MRMSLTEAVRVMDAVVVGPPIDLHFSGAATDSRKVQGGELFFALRGPRNDGHNFIGEALRRGALAAVVERWPVEGLPEKIDHPVLVVRSSLHALGELARRARQILSSRVVAITGTAGKTGTKEMTAQICRAAIGEVFQRPVAATEGSQNNLIGLPLTILNLTGDEEVVVLEMGMNALGEIARLTEIADPDVGLITNIGLAHLRPSPGSISLTDTPKAVMSLEGVAQAKGELWRTMRADGVAVVNLDDPNVLRLGKMRGGKQITFSLHPDHPEADVKCLKAREMGLDGQEFELAIRGEVATVRLRSPGPHQRANALASAAIGHALGIPLKTIARALRDFAPLKMRGETITLGKDIVIINDAYNANPLSMASSLRTLASLPARRRVVVLGDMKELGDASVSAHQELGRLVAELGIDQMFCIGEFARELARGALSHGMKAECISIVESVTDLAKLLRGQLREGDRVLLKASRAIGLEAVLPELEKQFS